MADFDKINIDTVTYTVKDSAARESINQEIQERNEQYNSLNDRITRESEARHTVDDALAKIIESEASARQQADSSLENKIASISKTVKDYGAIGDGVTDDTDAFKACMAANVSVIVPPGVYKLGSYINFANHSVIGQMHVQIYDAPRESPGAVIVFTQKMGCYKSNFRNITIVSSTTNWSTKAYAAFSNTNPSRGDSACDTVFENCTIAGFDCVVNSCRILRFFNCLLTQNTVALRNIEDSIVSGCYLYSNNEWAYATDSMGAMIFTGCKIEWNGKPDTNSGGIDIYQTAQITISGCIFDRNGMYNLRIANSSNVTVESCIFARASTANIVLNNSEAVTLYGSSYAKRQNDDSTSAIVPAISTILNQGNHYDVRLLGTGISTPWRIDNTPRNSLLWYNNVQQSSS